MINIRVRNVNHALFEGAALINKIGVKRESRNGPVLVAPCPVTTTYEVPTERVMLHPGRDANPFFHLVEALWMVAGRNDLEPLTRYVKNMSNFSDDGGVTQPGAYGARWRAHFAYLDSNGDIIDRDQIKWAIKRLKADPNDRRVVIQMYDADTDQDAADNGGRDIPCNLCALPSVGTDGRLNLTVYNRSNDMVWGAYGANAVHFSVLQELLAAGVGVPVGTYYQVSNNFHAYLNTLGKAGDGWPWDRDRDPYASGWVRPTPMFQGRFDLEQVTDQVDMLLEDFDHPGITLPFLREVAAPMMRAHSAFRLGSQDAVHILSQMPEDNDWRAGAELWITNRKAAREIAREAQ